VFNSTNNQELLKYNLSDNYAGKTALIVGEVYRHEGDWKFSAIGEGFTVRGISDIANKYM
jgi:stress response protein SCP2